MKSKKFKSFFNKKTQKYILALLSSPLGEIIKLTSIITIVTFLSYGITRADDLNPFRPSIEDATTNFSVIGTVSIVDDTHIIITNAKGSDDTGEQEYNLNIKHLETIETNSYQTLSLEDIHIGGTVIAQGVTNGSIFFIKRLISFSSTDLPEQTATTTPDVATSTQNIATSTDDTTEEHPVSDTSNTASPQEEQSTSTQNIATSTDDTAEEHPVSDTSNTASPQEEQSTSTQNIATSTAIDTVSDILESGIDIVSNIFVNILQDISQPVTEEPALTPVSELIIPSTPEESLAEFPPVQ